MTLNKIEERLINESISAYQRMIANLRKEIKKLEKQKESNKK